MTSIVMAIALKFLTVDGLCQLAARVIANLLSWASKKGGKAWDISKDVITKINTWTSLFIQVYDDDTMSEEEEAIVAKAIKDRTQIAKLVDILKNPIEEQAAKEVAKVGK